MTDPSLSSPETPPRAKRISTPRLKKTAKIDPEPKLEPVSPEPTTPSNEWPEPEPASTGGSPTIPDSPKRKRRRKKGKGNQQPTTPPTQDAEPPAESTPEPTPHAAHIPRPQHPPRIKVDAEAVAKLACKIYLAEVSEEGVALIGDTDAKELSRRCFRLAEIFLEEQTRRR